MSESLRWRFLTIAELLASAVVCSRVWRRRCTVDREAEDLFVAEEQDTRKPWGVPIWVWVVALLLAAVEPAVALWATYSPPAGLAPTGLDIGDSVVFLHGMRMFATDYFAPHATCQSPAGFHSVAYFATPYFWLYGPVGSVGRLLGLPEPIAIGFANGLGGFAYLMAVYFFLRMTFVRRANLAFLLFALAGGPGGILFVVTKLCGWQNHPLFEAYFLRFAFYELIEGTRTVPVLMMTRLYYTLPLACCYVALGLFVRVVRGGRPMVLWWVGALMFVGTFFNLRVGPMAWGVGVLYLYFRSEISWTRKIGYGAALGAGAFAAACVTWPMLHVNAAFAENVNHMLRFAMWLSPFVSVSLLHVFFAPKAIARDLRRYSGVAGAVGWSVAGYLIAFVVLFVGWHVYYGTYLRCGDAAASLWVSDKALAGALMGMLYGVWHRKSSEHVEPSETDWVTVWFLVYLAAAISSFSGGRYLQLSPQRVMGLLGPPLCILTAGVLHELFVRRPRMVRWVVGVAVACGLCSTGVYALYFKGPLDFVPGESPFSWVHYEAMSAEDAACLGHLGEGTVLSSSRFGDYATVRGNSTLFGEGTVIFSQLSVHDMDQAVQRFFSEGMSNEERLAFVKKWCVDWIYCPHAPAFPEPVVKALRSAPWLEEVASEGHAVLFRVRQ